MSKSKLLSLPRTTKKAMFVIHDVLLIAFTFWLSIALRLDLSLEWKNMSFWGLLAISVPVTIFAFVRLGLYRAVLRYFGNQVLMTCLLGSLVSVLVLVLSAFFLHISLPRSIPVMFFLLLFASLVGSRWVFRAWLQSGDSHEHIPVIIYGAGESGRQLLEAIRQVNEYQPVAFVDDDPRLQKVTIKSLTVYSPTRISHLVANHHIKKILLAIPSADGDQRRQIMRQLEPHGCEVLTIPGMKDLVDGRVSLSALKKVSVMDLLGRSPVDPVPELIAANIKNKTVMVTGAGGSIGAELCRQIVFNKPQRIILFELSEYFLYSIDKELSEFIRVHDLPIEIVPLLGSVQQKKRLLSAMQTFNVQTIYHAAAYKHVPMVEYNTIEGVRNNVFGTLHCAQAAMDAGVETFVLISTDKAVRPTNTMGATKRMAELVLQGLSDRTDHQTRFCLVRFGNVLGSSGSVIPLFEKQIEQGGPITLTHSEITRYFMTIPEAAQLVIQAGAMGRGGDVFLLDMGQPVKIKDLAIKMIHLSGLSVRDENNPDGDIEIKITGLRPGEKLYEELLIGESARGTQHPRILTAQERKMNWNELEEVLDQLDSTCKAIDPVKTRDILLNTPLAFEPSSDLCDAFVSAE